MRSILKFVLVVTLSAATMSRSCNKQPPNIVLIMADDLGIDDVSNRGSKQFVTANIDALGYHGITFDRLYSAWLCTPSRAALLTGRFPTNIGMQESVILNHEPWGLPEQYTTMANIFQDAGYSTSLVGKWHLGSAKKEWTPIYRGFQNHYGYYGGYIDYWHRRASLPVNNSLGVGYDFWRNLDVECPDPEQYVTDLFTNEAERVIMRHNIRQPLFLMVNHLAGHAAQGESLQAPQSEIDKFDYIKDPQKRIYAAMVSKLDESVGRIVDALHSRAMLQNSIIIFYSDNGAPSTGLFANTGSNWPLRGQKQTPWEGGIRVAGAIWSPLLRRRSRIWRPSVHVTDFLPTLATAAGIKLSENLPLDGHDLWKALSSGRTHLMPRDRIIVHGMDEKLGATSYMRGVWKYINGTTQYTDVLTSRNYDENDPRDEHYAETVHSSLASRRLRKFDYFPLDDDTINTLRAQAEIKCNPRGEKPQRVCDVNTPECLFRIDEDPCEQNNLASLPEYSEILRSMQQDVEWQRRHSVPPVNQRGIPQSSPRLHNCVWSMFLDEPTEEMVQCSNYGRPC